MLIYGDTSFIVALFLIQGRSYRAIEIADRLSEPLPLNPFADVSSAVKTDDG
jgi:hypothetical protein